MQSTVIRSLVLVLAFGAAASAQQVIFKTSTRTVAVYTTVADQHGRLVSNLDRNAFEVTDNGKEQEITLFAHEVQPITAVVLLDRSISMRANFELVEQAAEVFVAELQSFDKARIGSFSNRVQVDPHDFTSDRLELLEILRTDLQEEGPTPLWNAVDAGITSLVHQPGRRVILVFTDGADNPANSEEDNCTLKHVMKRAEQNEVIVYAIGLSGDPLGGAPCEKPDAGLAKLAAQTGGGYFELVSTDDLSGAFKRVADELHSQYVIGFTPSRLDGKTHALKVRIRNARMTARARRTYVATPSQAN
jgi:Ca-activated chloride channel homolog